MIKSLARAVSLGSLLCSPLAGAYTFGEHAAGTVDKLIHDYPGRYRDTASFAGAADWMESRMGSGYALGRQGFSWNDGTRTSQNVVASAAGLGDQYVVIGAHFDTYFGRPTLQGLDDNASGAGVLTEVARNLSGLRLENGLEIVGFGAEEEGLRGSRAYVAALDDARRANLLAMVNIDSLITGDMMYAHAGQNSVDNPALASLREHAARIAGELGIDLRANPGLNPEYPAGTGCCSDGEAFEGLNVPILYVESTNWDIGDLDGYDQTLALLPLNGEQSSVVLTLPPREIERLRALDEDAFAREMERRFDRRLGAMRLASERHAYPLVGAYAEKLVGPRCALIGDAAVGMHPVTAHGFNFGLGSVQRLSAAVLAAKARREDIAAPAVLARYARQHRLATWPLYQATNLLVDVYTDDRLPLKLLRGAGLRVAQGLLPLKKGIARHLTSPG